MMVVMDPLRSCGLLAISCLISRVLVPVDAGNLDRFTYRDDATGQDGEYGPSDWDHVQCADLDVCLGWPDSFETGVGWELEENSCRWCPASGNNCGTHHQSPINLQRNVAIAGHPKENECIDVHWMAYHDSSCTFEDLVDQNAFSIERHTLKIVQPIQEMGNDTYRIACSNEGRRWGRIDFSKGFSHWWHLSHIDFHVPSEHTQEGKRYSGELQMHHFYSVSGEEAGVNNEMAAVSFFLEAYEDSSDFDVLNRIICQWRKSEDVTREQCGLPSVLSEYPGCFYYRRGFDDDVVSPAGKKVGGGRQLRGGSLQTRHKAMSAHDIIAHNFAHGHNNTSFVLKRIVMEESDFEPHDPDFDWDAFIRDVYEREERAKTQETRKLLDYQHVGPWFNYFPLIACKTEYYYRYSGTQTVPPCYGKFTPNSNRGFTNHWRVMKDPIRVSQRQIDEMHRLIKERIAPHNDPIRPCQPDTAAKKDPTNPKHISVARPLQSNHIAHFKVFCECQDWGSKWIEDKRWCQQDQFDRFYSKPYNFETDGF